jgi:hypothetical protein
MLQPMGAPLPNLDGRATHKVRNPFERFIREKQKVDPCDRKREFSEHHDAPN